MSGVDLERMTVAQRFAIEHPLLGGEDLGPFTTSTLIDERFRLMAIVAVDT